MLSDYLWPDRDNTFVAFEYKRGGLVTVKANHASSQKAQNMFDLVGLGKHPTGNPPTGNTPKDLSASDRRWVNRRDTWNMAEDSKADLTANDTEQMRRQIVRTAAGGYWSIWMTVFSDDPDMLKRLIQGSPGVCQDCFDAKHLYVPVARPGGQC